MHAPSERVRISSHAISAAQTMLTSRCGCTSENATACARACSPEPNSAMTRDSGRAAKRLPKALVAATLGTKSDEQKIEALEGESYRHFMLHYNFPSFSVGEVRRFGSPSRRDIGHGALAERAVEAVLPAKEAFP